MRLGKPTRKTRIKKGKKILRLTLGTYQCEADKNSNRTRTEN
jgi:hypothetical protein